MLGVVQLVAVQINLSRALQPAELMYQIIRRLYEGLQQMGLLRKMPAELRSDLFVAYARTWAHMSHRVAAATDRTTDP